MTTPAIIGTCPECERPSVELLPIYDPYYKLTPVDEMVCEDCYCRLGEAAGQRRIAECYGV